MYAALGRMIRFSRHVLASIIISFGALFYIVPMAQAEEWTFGEAAKELISRFPKWYAYEHISDDFVVFVPLIDDVVTKPVEGGAKRIAEDPNIFLFGTTANAANSIRGELRLMKKNGARDVFDAFKTLIDKQKKGESYENVLAGNRLAGKYTFVYRVNDEDITYEMVDNTYGQYAISYKLTTKYGVREQDIARKMIASYLLLRRCASDNFGDTNCVFKDPQL